MQLKHSIWHIRIKTRLQAYFCNGMCSKGPPVGMVPHKSLLDTSLRKIMTTEDMFLGNSIVGRGLKTGASEILANKQKG